jgi:tRNA(fMet)-specific endonuclease VapC
VGWLIASCSTAAGCSFPPSCCWPILGLYHVGNPAPLLQKIADLLNDVQVLDFDHSRAQEFGKVRGGLLQQGISVPTADMMIAAVALFHNLTLVTNNTADFQRIPGLRLEDWLTP